MPHTLPIRRSSRLMIVSPQNRLLLFRYNDEHSGEFWATAGGELQRGEDDRAAAERELLEETGYRTEIGDLLEERDAVYAVARSTPARWLEKYFLVRVETETIPCRVHWTEEEQATITAQRWWSIEDLAQQKIDLKPAWIARLFQTIISPS